MAKFEFTQPKTVYRKTDYFKILQEVNRGYSPMWNSRDVRYSHMTWQCLAEAGLLEYVRGKGFVITSSGKNYVSYVNSINRPEKHILRTILKTAKSDKNMKRMDNVL